MDDRIMHCYIISSYQAADNGETAVLESDTRKEGYTKFPDLYLYLTRR